MKTTILILMILFAATAFGQTGVAVLSNQPLILHMPEHPLHAENHSLSRETPLVGGGEGSVSYAHGERPLWEFGPISDPVPLGDIARQVRKEKLNAKKAEFVYEKQGS